MLQLFDNATQGVVAFILKVKVKVHVYSPHSVVNPRNDLCSADCTISSVDHMDTLYINLISLGRMHALIQQRIYTILTSSYKRPAYYHFVMFGIMVVTATTQSRLPAVTSPVNANYTVARDGFETRRELSGLFQSPPP